MNELQKCEYEILKKVLGIIDDNHLKSYLVCGTALGAVKYGGFIPWDDDIDIALPRSDYEKFVEIMGRSQDEEIELQNYRYDKNVPFFYTKIRNRNTTYIESSVVDFDINHGVFIDVFPLDGYPLNKFEAYIFEIRKKFIWRFISFVFTRKESWKNTVIFPVKLIARKNLNLLVKYYEKMVSKYDISESELICNYGNSPLKNEYSPKWHYGDGKAVLFENLSVRVPENYDAYLNLKYGDWKADLPEEEKVGHHYYEICDLYRSYVEYIEKNTKGKTQIKR